MCVNQLKILTFQELGSPLGFFGLNSFDGFVILVRRMDSFVCLVFYLFIKMQENLYKKPYRTWQAAVKTFKKHQNVPPETHKTRQTLFHRLFLRIHIVSNVPPFLKGKMKIG